MRPPTTARGLAVILLAVAVLPLGALAAVSVDAIQERAVAAQRAEAENVALTGAVCVSTLMASDATAREALEAPHCTGTDAYLMEPSGARVGPGGQLPPDAALADAVGTRASGSMAWEGGYIAWSRVPAENLVLVTTHHPQGVDAVALWGLPMHGWGTAAIAASVGLIALALARRWVSAPLQRLADATQRVAAGRWDERAPEGGTAETVEVARAFNRMAEEVARKQRQLEEANGRLDALARARTEQLAHAVEDLAAFSFTVNHELREPLRSLETLAGVVLEDPDDGLPDDARELFETVRGRTGRLQAVTQSLLRYDDVGREEHTVEEVALDDVVDEAVARVEDVLEARGASVERPHALPAVRGNHRLLVDLVAELLENGATYNKAPAPVVTVRPAPAGVGEVALSVEDNGIGVAPDRREESFHLFRRLHPQGTYSNGTGVGLALARRVARFHDGDLTMEAAPGGGTRLVLVLPAEGPAPRPELPAPRAVREF